MRDPEKKLYWIPETVSGGKKNTGCQVRIRNTEQKKGNGKGWQKKDKWEGRENIFRNNKDLEPWSLP
jgi:hypothetical protein